MAYREHRRIDISGGFAADPDWSLDNTLPTFAPAADSSGAIDDFVPRNRSVLLFAELRDGMSDAALLVAPGAFLYTARVFTRSRPRANDIVSSRDALAGIEASKEQVEDELGRGNASWIGIMGATDLGAANAIWVYTDVET